MNTGRRAGNKVSKREEEEEEPEEKGKDLFEFLREDRAMIDGAIIARLRSGLDRGCGLQALPEAKEQATWDLPGKVRRKSEKEK